MMTAATITIVLLLVALIVMYNLERERDSLGIYVFALVFLVGTGMILGSEISSVFTVKYKKKPMMHVECNGSKCDTTYIYKFNQ